MKVKEENLESGRCWGRSVLEMPVKSNTFAFVLACSLSGVASFVPSPSLPRLVSPLRTHAPISVGLQTNNILILDHLNINHEKGRHDLLKAFYFDVLKCAVDPRKWQALRSARCRPACACWYGRAWADFSSLGCQGTTPKDARGCRSTTARCAR